MYATFLFDPAQLSLLSPVLLTPTHGAVPNAHCSFGDDSPNSVATCFHELARATSHRMQVRHARSLSIPAQLQTRTSANGKFLLTADAWRIALSGSYADLRMVKIDSAKSHIINVWIFPAAPQAMPVFAAELIGVHDAVRVAFIDIQAPVTSAISARLSKQLKPVAHTYASLPCDEAAPEWAISSSLGEYTYARNVGLSQLPVLRACYLHYFDLYLGHLNSIHLQHGSNRGKSAALEQLHAYQLHHMEHSPGKKFLGNLFGVDWTERFMLDFLFTQP